MLFNIARARMVKFLGITGNRFNEGYQFMKSSSFIKYSVIIVFLLIRIPKNLKIDGTRDK